MNIIKRKYGLEDITSRVPGLFPYIEFDVNNVSTVHPASDSGVGCYGKIPTAIMIPSDVSLVVDVETINEDGDTEIIQVNVINPDTVYSYRTLMIYYYRYRDDYPDSTFIQFMETGIGRFEITLDDVNSLIQPPLEPVTQEEFDGWILVPEYEYYANAARLNSEYENISIMCRKYEQMKEATGEINCELECLVEKFQKMGGRIMMEYYRWKAVTAKNVAAQYYTYYSDIFNLDFHINIVSNENDQGILNTFTVFFNPKKTYVSGEYVIYNDKTYVCVEDFDNNQKYPFGGYTKYNQQGYVCINEEGHIGAWASNDFKLIGDTIQISPNTAYFVLLSESYNISDRTLTGTSDSKLHGFRNNENYLDEGGDILTPSANTDWLWYYMIGDVGYSETITDEFNNIVVDGNRITTVDQYETHLMAYGDVITNIERDTTEHTLTFTYVIGAHLKAKYKDNIPDDDGNDHYFYGDFEYDDSDSDHGVLYTETYTYQPGGDIDSMDNTEFEAYITYGERYVTDTYKKCEFDTMMNTVYSQMMVNGVPIEYNYITSDFSTQITIEKDSLVSPTLKFDYLNGITYKPDVKNDVQVSRGNAAAWERHIKLSELKTFDDLETYANGGFFNLM